MLLYAVVVPVVEAQLAVEDEVVDELCSDIIELCWVVLEGLVAELVLVREVVLTGPVELADDAGELEDDESEEEL